MTPEQHAEAIRTAVEAETLRCLGAAEWAVAYHTRLGLLSMADSRALANRIADAIRKRREANP